MWQPFAHLIFSVFQEWPLLSHCSTLSSEVGISFSGQTDKFLRSNIHLLPLEPSTTWEQFTLPPRDFTVLGRVVL